MRKISSASFFVLFNFLLQGELLGINSDDEEIAGTSSPRLSRKKDSVPHLKHRTQKLLFHTQMLQEMQRTEEHQFEKLHQALEQDYQERSEILDKKEQNLIVEKNTLVAWERGLLSTQRTIEQNRRFLVAQNNCINRDKRALAERAARLQQREDDLAQRKAEFRQQTVELRQRRQDLEQQERDYATEMLFAGEARVHVREGWEQRGQRQQPPPSYNASFLNPVFLSPCAQAVTSSPAPPPPPYSVTNAVPDQPILALTPDSTIP